MKYLPNIPDAESDAQESRRSDFLTSEEERGLTRKSSWLWPVVGIAFIVLLLLYVSLVK